MTTTLNTSRSENTMVLSARVSACMYFLVVSVLGHPKGVGGLTSYFLRGGGMDVFWNDPLLIILIHLVFKANTEHLT